MPNAILIGLISETPVHVGIGQTADALDLPVARESTTKFPHIPGSGTKGGFRVWAKEEDQLNINQIFGHLPEDGDKGGNGAAGTLLFGEARLALLPIRSTNQAVRWVTSPLIISRLKRDLSRIGLEAPALKSINVKEGQYFGAEIEGGYLGLEEREFNRQDAISTELLDFFHTLTPTLDLSNHPDRLVILNDADLTWFAEFGLPISMRNSLNDDKQVKKGALWSEETMASDTVLSMIVAERKQKDSKEPLKQFQEEVKRKPHVQFGGNETIGQGWFSMSVYGGEG